MNEGDALLMKLVAIATKLKGGDVLLMKLVAIVTKLNVGGRVFHEISRDRDKNE